MGSQDYFIRAVRHHVLTPNNSVDYSTKSLCSGAFMWKEDRNTPAAVRDGGHKGE